MSDMPWWGTGALVAAGALTIGLLHILNECANWIRRQK